ncbi:hypothetical protein SFUMM280S_00306 [Streptomyces fumanus]
MTRHIRVVAEPVLDTDGRPLLVRGAYRGISAQHWTEVALAATRDQLAHTEQQAHERNRLTLQLQHAIMPPAQGPLKLDGLQVAVRYRPAETEQLVGGDWYDVVVLPNKLVLLCVGDAHGHLPPVLVRDRQAAPLPLVKGLLLGAVPEAVYEEAEVQLAAQSERTTTLPLSPPAPVGAGAPRGVVRGRRVVTVDARQSYVVGPLPQRCARRSADEE